MIVLKDSLLSQTFKFIPREYVADSMDITEEGADLTVTFAISPTRVGYDGLADTLGTYLSVSDIFTLKEGSFYSLTVYNGSNVVYKDKIFCTNQAATSLEYTINKDEYTEHATNNEFIILD